MKKYPAIKELSDAALGIIIQAYNYRVEIDDSENLTAFEEACLTEYEKRANNDELATFRLYVNPNPVKNEEF
jgi:hypothetical protein